MSFRTRLTSFFVVIVIVPMLAFGFLVFRLISQSQQGKADARANGLATAAGTVYTREAATARADAETIARSVGSLHGGALRARVAQLAAQAGIARITVDQGAQRLVDIGTRSALAPGVARVTSSAGSRTLTVTTSELTANDLVHDLLAHDVGVVVRQGQQDAWRGACRAGVDRAPTTRDAHTPGLRLSRRHPGLQGVRSRPGGDNRSFQPLRDRVFSQHEPRDRSAFIAGFLLLAFSFSVLASKALQGQLSRFLQAARRLGTGDFSSPVPIEGHDEFAALGEEFNRMSNQLENRIGELARERARLRESIRRSGQTFASNLDRPVLLDLALRTAADAVHADFGRLTARAHADESLTEAAKLGSFSGADNGVIEAERSALKNGDLGEHRSRRSQCRIRDVGAV